MAITLEMPDSLDDSFDFVVQPTNPSESAIAAEELLDAPDSEDGNEVDENGLGESEEKENASDGLPVDETADPVIEWKLKIRQAQETFTDIAIAHAESQANTKALKKQMDLALEMLRDVISDGPKPAVKPIAETTHAENGLNSIPAETPTSDKTPDSAPKPYPQGDWRSVPIADLGLPNSLAEKLADACLVTIGNLEDRRAAISLGHEKWPKGIGVAKITAIEDAVIAWLSKHRDAAVLAESRCETIEVVGETIEAIPGTISTSSETAELLSETVDMVEAVEPKPKKKTRKPKDVASDANSDAAGILLRAKQIDDNSPDCLDHKHSDGDKFWQSGFEAWDQNAELSDCPYIPGAEQDDWLRGWMTHDFAEKYEVENIREANY